MLKIRADHELIAPSSLLTTDDGITEVDLPSHLSGQQEEDGDREDLEGSCGEGNNNVHGKLHFRTNDRSILFSSRLDEFTNKITCLACQQNCKSFPIWRLHCLQHQDLPGLTPTLVSLYPPENDSRPFPQKRFQCERCKRKFATAQERNEHNNNTVRIVRLVCPQCNGQYSDLEQHIQESHQGCVECGKCGLETIQLVAHCHSLHQGFSSVLAESTTTCFGDGISAEWKEVVLETPAFFLASEVKPDDSEPAESPLPKSQVNPHDSIQLKSANQPLIKKENKLENIVFNHQDETTSSLKFIPRYSDDSPVLEMSIEQREQKNIEEYERYKEDAKSKIGIKNECEICGFIPYTKNKYREKQDHLAKMHFKEKIDRLLPKRPYLCPIEQCEYNGKDRQDILRHYTGKHNILKMWVDEFLKSRKNSTPSALSPGRIPSLGLQKEKLTGAAGGLDSNVLTFADMEAMAREKEMEMRGKKRTHNGIEISELKKENGVSTIFTNKQSSQAHVPIKPKLEGYLGVAHDLLNTPVTGTVTISTPSGQISLSRQSRYFRKSVEKVSESFKLLTAPEAGAEAPVIPLYLYKCDQCTGKVVFKSIEGLKHHKIVEHPLEDEEIDVDPLAASPPASVLPLTKEHQCIGCSMRFISQQALDLHQSICKNTAASSSLAGVSLVLGTSLLSSVPITSLTVPGGSSVTTTPLTVPGGSFVPITPLNVPGGELPKKKARRPPPNLVPI
ncbi:uncharacterized protein LOC111711306 isoform X2 [Eurytemora carolleeae]|uniref:uncharacterized protein LOC111711306 isoform X2 n=1 Tax=Eurytemora carolleeae TaxID=1294199 RepID=UPI000C762556|nr:uncharacterized protein LOC111711306 isoform X2 [Eurytemora carolleeae]|eukprot:XP_023341404.1 uncharacterized protein LOC111711306 isoform X2 [Eurytemora affinis]